MGDKETFHYRFMNEHEGEPVYQMIAQIFSQVIAPDYSAEGVQEFLQYLQPDLLIERNQEQHFILLALTERETIVGMIEVRYHAHVSLLFVDEAFQGRGISRALWERALLVCQEANPGLSEISVNASPNARPVYERFGFEAIAPEQTRNGICFVPMVFKRIKGD